MLTMGRSLRMLIDRRRWARAALAVAILAGCTASDGDADGELLVDLTDDVVSECLNFPVDQGPDVEKLPIVDCEDEHSHEIFAVIRAAGVGTDDVYPGFDALEEFAQVNCLEDFESYVGVNAFDSSLFYSWIVPSLTTWNDPDILDRQILCVTGSGDGRQLIGSVKGTAI